jgi:uncharacterized lipoprotein YddW (UPF0748 family)
MEHRAAAGYRGRGMTRPGSGSRPFASAVLAIAPAVFGGACSSVPRLDPELGRCIWIDRWDYRSAEDVRRIVNDCQRAGFTTLLWQVRGNGTVYYPSNLEVWAEQFQWQDPGFDPLGAAVREAHALGLKLHAWVNVMPGWTGDQEPAEPRQLWRQRRDWFLQDRDGNWQRRKAGKYLALNPCLPEVRAYLAELCREIVTRYEVDGIHLDYIRFPDGEGDDADQLGRDPVSLSMFTTTTGKATADIDAFRVWQIKAVTATVAGIRTAISGGRRVLLTAAVLADREKARRVVRQDWPEWCKQGLVDAVFPMNYTGDDGQFLARVEDAVDHARGCKVISGVGVYRLSGPEQSVRQLEVALQGGARGVAVFNYRTLFGPPAKDQKVDGRAVRESIGHWFDAQDRRR